MTLKKAVQLAIGALRSEAQKFAFDASLHDMYKVDDPSCVKASHHRRDLLDAIDTLTSLATNGSKTDA